MNRLLVCITFFVLALIPPEANATWSIIAADQTSRQVVIASATCASQSVFAPRSVKGLMDVQAIIVPGVGIAAAQAAVDFSRANQALIYQELKKGTHPSVILQMLMADPEIQTRQFGIVDLQGRFAGFSGASNQSAAMHVEGQVPESHIYYSIQGNILRSNAVIENAVRAFETPNKILADRVMAAMEAANAAGGDQRCSCTSEPTPKGRCTRRNALIAYILAADPSDVVGTVHGDGKSHNDGKYALYLYVSDENTQPNESVDPVTTLGMRYQAWKMDRSHTSR